MSRATVIALLAGVIALTPVTVEASEAAAPPPASASEPEAAPPPQTSATAPTTGTPLVLKSEAPSASARPSTDLGVATKVGACALVLGAAVWAFKRRRATAKADPDAKPALSLVSRLSLGNRTEVCVIEADGQRLVLGITPQSISALTVVGLDHALVEAEPSLEPSRERRPAPRLPPIETTERTTTPDREELTDEPPTVSRREINQTGVQRISRAPHEGLLRLFERTRTLTRSPGPETEETPAEPRERRHATRDVGRIAEAEERPLPRRVQEDPPRARAASSRAHVEGQARGLASLRSKR